jgi:glycosyltransferase involved in cell wall biosynthesis
VPTSAMLPLVTIVIPTYERLPLLKFAVDSIVTQTYPNWELIIADDGSTDGTADWVRGLGDARIRVVSRAHNGYLGYIRNFGVEAGTGTVVAFLDSDDLWLPCKLEKQVAAMNASCARWCFAGFKMMDADCKPIPMRAGEWRPKSGNVIREVLTTDLGVSISSLMIQRTLFDEVGHFNDSIYREDHELAMRLALHAEAIAVPDVLVRIRDHGGRMSGVERSHELTAHIYDLFLAQKPPADLARLARDVRGRHLVNAGAQRLTEGDWLAGARLFVRSLSDSPGARRWLRGVGRGVRGRIRAKRHGT